MVMTRRAASIPKSEARLRANRLNAQKSTGPKTAAGKAKVGRNNFRHGLLTQHLLAIGENAADLEALHDQLFEQLKPEGILEEFLVEKIIDSIWRGRRVTMADRMTTEARDYTGKMRPMDKVFAPKADNFAAVLRYQSAMERSMYRSLHELQRLQAIRSGGSVDTPKVVDVIGDES